MDIKRLELSRFKCFYQADLEFKKGLNIIKGPNESGKSTLRMALLAAFFGNPTSSSETTQSWTSWGQTERCELRLEFIDDAQNDCQLRKDFAAGKIFLLQGEETYRTAKTIQNKLIEELGFPTEEYYVLCAALDVRTLANLGNAASRKEISKMLAGLMTGTASGQDSLSALRQLDEGVKELSKGLHSPSKTPGPLKAAQDRLTHLQAQKIELEKRLQTYQLKTQAWEEIDRQHASMKNQLDILEHLQEANRKLIMASQRKAELIIQDAQFEKTQTLQRKLEQDLHLLNQDLDKLPMHIFSAKDIQELQQLVQEKRQFASLFPTAPVNNQHFLWYVALGTLGIFLGLVAWLTEHPLMGLLGLLTGCGFALAAGVTKNQQKKKISQYQNQVGQQQIKMGALEERCKTFFQKAGGIDPEEILHTWPQSQQLLARQEALLQQRQSLDKLDESRWQAVRRELRSLEDILNDPTLLALKSEPVALAKLQKEHALLTKQWEELSQQRLKLQTLFQQSTLSQEEMNALEEQIEESRERIRYLENREKICSQTYQFLNQARRKTMNPAREVLAQRAGEIFQKLSLGHYQKIMLDDEDLSIKVLILETKRWEDPGVLSQGTFDQLYLSLRLALAEILAGGKKPPLLLDEPFAAFDLARLSTAKSFLRQIANERQILLFTCRPEYDEIADHILELPVTF